MPHNIEHMYEHNMYIQGHSIREMVASSRMNVHEYASSVCESMWASFAEMLIADDILHSKEDGPAANANVDKPQCVIVLDKGQHVLYKAMGTCRGDKRAPTLRRGMWMDGRERSRSKIKKPTSARPSIHWPS